MLMLRELRRDDVLEINRWRSNRELISHLGSPFRYIGPEVEEAWFESYLKSRKNCIRCAIVEDQFPDLILGLVTVSGIDWVSRSGVLHIMIGDSGNRGKGIGSFAVEEMIRHSFDDMGLHRIELNVLAANGAAIHFYEKLGFFCEGKRREAVFKSGEYEDMYLMAILAEDWRKKSSAGLEGDA